MADDDTEYRSQAPRLSDFRDRASRNPFSNDAPAIVQPFGALASAEQQRAVAEIQARMVIARANPRNPIKAMDDILRDCTRSSLAQQSQYRYARGGTSIEGPSIRLAEAIAQRWGNIASGIRELSRANGYSECAAYAWDLESGYYDERQFQVRHWRDTQKGGYALTDERDIYELIANLGQRRKRAVLLTVIPGDVVDAAIEQCDQTLRTTVDVTPEGLKKLSDSFAAYGVNQQQIEKRCQCRLEAIRPAQVIQLRKIFMSLKDGMSEPKDWFETNAWTEVAERHAGTATEGEGQRQAPPRQRRQRAEQATPKPGPAREAAPEPTTKTEPPEQAKQAKQEPTPFEAVLIDPWGEVGEETFTDPVAFASALLAMKRESCRGNPELLANLKTSNDDAIADAIAADPAADRMLADFAVPDQPGQAEAPGGPAEDPTAPIEFAAVVPPVERGQKAWRVWVNLLKDDIAGINDDDLSAWLDAQRQQVTEAPMAQRALAVRAVVSEFERAHVPVPAWLVDAIKPQDTDLRWAEGTLADLERIKQTDAGRIAFDNLWRLSATQTVMARLARERPELFKRVDEAFAEKAKMLPAAPGTAAP